MDISKERLDRFSNIMNENLLSENNLSDAISNIKSENEAKQKKEQDLKNQELKLIEAKRKKEQDVFGLDILTAPTITAYETAGKTAIAFADSVGYLGFNIAEKATNAAYGINNLFSSHKKNYADYSKNYKAFEDSLREREKAMSAGAEQLQSDISKNFFGRKEQSLVADAINSRTTAEIASTILEYANATSLVKKGTVTVAKKLGKEAPKFDTLGQNVALMTGATVTKQAIFNDADQETIGNVVLKTLDKESRDGIIGAIAKSVAIDETDTAFEKRMKIVFSELPLGVAGELLMPTVKWLKTLNKGKEADYSKIKNISGEEIEKKIDEQIVKIEETPLPNEKNVLLKSVQIDLEKIGINKSLDDLVKTAEEQNITILQSNGDVTAKLVDDYTKMYTDIYGNPNITVTKESYDKLIAANTAKQQSAAKVEELKNFFKAEKEAAKSDIEKLRVAEQENIALQQAELAAKTADDEFNFVKQAFDVAEESNFVSKNLNDYIKNNRLEISNSIKNELDNLKTALIQSAKEGKQGLIDNSINGLKTIAKNVGVELDDKLIKSSLKSIEKGDTAAITENLINSVQNTLSKNAESNLRSSFKNQGGFLSGQLLGQMVGAGAGAVGGSEIINEGDTDAEKIMKILGGAALGFGATAGGIALYNKYKGKTQAEIIDKVKDIKEKLVENPVLFNKVSGILANKESIDKFKLTNKESKLAKELEKPLYKETTETIQKVLDNAHDDKAINSLIGEDFKQTYAILDNLNADNFEKNIANLIYGEKFDKLYQSNDATVALADLKQLKNQFGIEDVSKLMTTPISKLPEELVRAKRFITQLSVKLKESSVELNKVNKALENNAKTGVLNYNNLTVQEATNLRDMLRIQQKRDLTMLTYSTEMVGNVTGQTGRSLQILNRSVDVSTGGLLQRQQLKKLTSDLNVDNIDNIAQIIAENADGNLLDVLNIARVSKFDRITDAIMYIRLSGLLSSPKSLAVNTLGGALQTAKESVVDYIAAGVGLVNNGTRGVLNNFGLKLKIADDKISFGEANIKAVAKVEAALDFFSGILPFIKNIKKEGLTEARDILATKVAKNEAVKTYVNEGFVQDASVGAINTINPVKNFFVNPRNEYEKGLKSVIDVIGTTVGIPLEAMKATDQLIYGVQFRSEIYGLAYRQAHKELKSNTITKQQLAGRIEELKANPTDDMINKAYEESKKVTFQQDLRRLNEDGVATAGVIGDAAASINMFREKSPVIGKTIVPFVKTPTNLTIETLESTPLALVPGLTRSKEEWLNIMKQGGEEADRLVAKMIIGSSIIGYGMSLYSEGRLTADNGFGKGIFSTDEEDKAKGITSKTKTGVKGYSLKIGDKYYNVARESVIGTFLQVGAQYQYALDKGASTKEYDQAVWGALLAGGKVLGDKTFVQGFVELNKAMTDSSRNDNGPFQKYAANQLSTLVPLGGLQRDINNLVSPELKEFHGLFDRMKSKTLTMKNGLYNKRDAITGEVLTNQDFSMFNPFEKSLESASGLVNELDRIGYVVKTMPKNINGVQLDGLEYDNIQKYVTQGSSDFNDGKTLKQALLDLVNTDEYYNADDGQVYNYDGSNTRVRSQEELKPVKGTKQYMVDKIFDAYKKNGIEQFMLKEQKGKDVFVNKNIGKYLNENGSDYKAAKIHAENDFLEMVKNNQ